MKHLIVDGLAYNGTLLRDTDALSAWLIKITQILGMEVMKGPMVVEVAGFGSNAGITGIVIVSESHIAVHTWPERNDCTVNIDVFSCRDFDWKDLVTQIALDWFISDGDYKTTVISRPLRR